MISTETKLSIVGDLRFSRSECGRSALAEIDPNQHRALLRWLDESGLTLYLAAQLESQGLMKSLPRYLAIELTGRVKRNELRTKQLLEEFRRVNECLNRAGIPHVVLKGFSLAPDFCQSVSSRHQTDIDLLARPEHVERGSEALKALGYCRVSQLETGETKLCTPLEQVPLPTDDLYGIPRHSCVEFHLEMFEPANEVTMRLRRDWEEALEQREVNGIAYWSLDLPRRMLVQLLHAFRHVLHGWLRLGWLFEISYAVKKFGNDTQVWSLMDAVLGSDPKARRACGLVLELTRTLFGIQIPVLAEGWIAELTPSMLLWVHQYGGRWATAEFPGSRLSLLVHREFVDGRDGWRRLRMDRSARAFDALSATKLLNLPFVYENLCERLEYMREFFRWRRLLAQSQLGRENRRIHVVE